MLILTNRNVNGMFLDGVHTLAAVGERSESRAGPVIVSPEPVMSVYERPRERVLLDPRRDANPFFHLYESLWMLAGRRDAGSLNRYVADFGKRFGEPDGTIHDAYGYRWRHALGFDQLDEVVEKLRRNPDDRQCVIQMWDATPTHGVELGKHGVGDAWIEQTEDAGMNDLRREGAARPCNTQIFLRVRTEDDLNANDAEFGMSDHKHKVLDLTVMCRSNDIIWGAYGANAVQFSMLQEYLAGRIGVAVGRMYQFSNNWHGYVDALDRLGPPENLETRDLYATGGLSGVSALPIGDDWSKWDGDLRLFMSWHDNERMMLDLMPEFVNNWFRSVAVPMCVANQLRRMGSLGSALNAIDSVDASDWHQAGRAWLRRRMERKPQAGLVGDVR